MQTFLPYDDFYRSHDCLDPKRLGNQVVRETLSLVNDGWENHPASMMWYGHFGCLALYGLVGLQVLKEKQTLSTYRRDYDFDLFTQLFMERYEEYEHERHPPDWFGDSAFHASHRSSLLRKDQRWYGQFGWSEPLDLPYVWPDQPWSSKPVQLKPDPVPPSPVRPLVGGRSLLRSNF